MEVDMDGVLVDIHEYLQKQVGVSVFDNAKRYRLEENEHLSSTTINAINRMFGKADTYRFAQPCEGAIDFVKSVVSQHKVIIHSLAVNEECKEAKLNWIQYWLGKDSFDVVIDIDQKTMLASDMVIEDSLENLRKSSSAKKVLINKPYNQQEFNTDYKDVFEEPGFMRIQSLVELV